MCPLTSNLAYPAIQVSTLGELLAIADKIVRSPSSNPAYPAILVPEAINPEKELLVMPCKIVHPRTSYLVYPAILVPEAINLERVISYAMQNRSRNPAYLAILV